MEENKIKRYAAFYRDPDELYVRVQEYFTVYVHGEKAKRTIVERDEDGIPREIEQEYYVRYPEKPTITGLCLFLGFTSRQSFYDMKKDENFKPVIEMASLMVENGYEQRGIDAKNPAFSIFVLKNMGWTDNITQNVNDTSAPRVTKVEIVKAIDPDEEDED